MKKIVLLCNILLIFTIGIVSVSSASTINQWASSVIDYSTQWNSTSWGAHQTLGAPDATFFGDYQNQAWATASHSGRLDDITLGFATNVYASGVDIYESDGYGFVYKIDVVALDDSLINVWNGTDTTPFTSDGTPDPRAYFTANWTLTGYLVKGVKIYIDTDLSPGWDEIDAVQLLGSDTYDYIPVPEPATTMLFALGLLGFTGMNRRKL